MSRTDVETARAAYDEWLAASLSDDEIERERDAAFAVLSQVIDCRDEKPHEYRAVSDTEVRCIVCDSR